jgi:hypothetical protein
MKQSQNFNPNVDLYNVAKIVYQHQNAPRNKIDHPLPYQLQQPVPSNF